MNIGESGFGPGAAGPLIRKIRRFVHLSVQAEKALAALEGRRRAVAPHTRLIEQEQRYDHLSVLIQGSAIRYKLLPDGRRQVVNFVLPGDIIGLRGCVFEQAFYSVTTLEACVVSPLEPNEIQDFVGTHPSLGAAVFWVTALEHTRLTERLVTLRRRSAQHRVAYLLLDLHERLEWVGLAGNGVFVLPVTQELIADTIGLSLVHVSRTLRRLQTGGLVSLSRRAVHIRDIDELAHLADYRFATRTRANLGLLPRSLFEFGSEVI